MRKLVIGTLGFVTLSVLSQPVSSEPRLHRILNHDASEIAEFCGRAGGQFHVDVDDVTGGLAYSCTGWGLGGDAHDNNVYCGANNSFSKGRCNSDYGEPRDTNDDPRDRKGKKGGKSDSVAGPAKINTDVSSGRLANTHNPNPAGSPKTPATGAVLSPNPITHPQGAWLGATTTNVLSTGAFAGGIHGHRPR